MNTAEQELSQSYELGGYEITATAGAGGMGIVYRGEDPALKRTVAIKVLKDELRAHPAVVARFRREAEAIATLDHPNIVRIYAVGECDGLPYIVMEYIEGTPLSDMLLESGSLDWEEVLDIGAQVADALACAHERQVIHRDIKPANILVCPDGSIRVTDFGIAKVLNASTQLTVDGARIGTPQYMCPERCRNLPITAASDIYSVGVMLFQCITGRLPYEAESSSDLITKIAASPPKRVRDYKPRVPEAVDRLIAYMLEKEASNRPPHGAALLAVIRRVQRGEDLGDMVPSMEQALASVRAETPVTLPADSNGVGRSPDGRLHRLWFGLDRRIRLGLALLVLALPVGLGLYVAGSAAPASVNWERHFLPHRDATRWTSSSSLTTFVRETTASVVGTIDLPDFRLAQVSWIGGAEGAGLLLEGAANTDRAGQQALLSLSPYIHRTDVAVPPFASPTDRDRPLALLTATRAGSDAPGVIAALAGGTWLVRTTPGAGPTLLDDSAARAGSVVGTTVWLALPVEEAARTQLKSVALMDGSAAAPSPQENWVGGVVTTMAAHSATGHLAMLTRDGDTTRLVTFSAGTTLAQEREIARGALALSTHAFSPTGGQLVYLTGTLRGEGRVMVQSIYNPVDSHEVGMARTAAFHPKDNELIVLADDHAGRPQLWRWAPRPGGERQQLTFIESGVGEDLTLSEDGQFAILSLPDRTRFLIVDLTRSPRDG